MYLNALLSDGLYAFDAAEPVALWLTVGFVCALLLTGALLYAFKREGFAPFAKYGGIAFAFYTLALGITLLVLNIAKRTDQAYLDENYLNGEVIPLVLLPLCVLFAVALVGGVALFIAARLQVKKSVFKGMGVAFGALLVLGVLTVGVLIGVYYFRHIAEDGYYNSDSATVNQTALYAFAGGLVLFTVLGALWLGRRDKTAFDSRAVAMAGVCIAMSFALSYIQLWKMPQGGSITLVSLLPLMIFAYLYGPKKGVLAGCIYGVLQAMQDPYIIHPAQFALDYPVAFAVIGFAGVFAGMDAIKLPQVRFFLGGVVAGILRFICHVLSGVFAFEAFAEGTNAWAYSLAYNSFVFVDLALVLVAGVLVFSSKSFVKQSEKYLLQPQES
ncbi:MAG: energy-coupled thiamine transporter ThiT [Clostridia bacterium]|nr:energy-coupled thiamine transporter ThiT [Clostridia bacterium]